MRTGLLLTLTLLLAGVDGAAAQAPPAAETGVREVPAILPGEPRATILRLRPLPLVEPAPPAVLGGDLSAQVTGPVPAWPASQVVEGPVELGVPRSLVPQPVDASTPVGPGGPAFPHESPTGPAVYGYPGRFWTSLDYLLWSTRNGPLAVPLVTTIGSSSSSSSTPGVPSGIPTGGTSIPSGTPTPSTPSSGGGTLVLVGGGGLDYGNYDGARLAGGCWLNAEQTLGIEASAFWVQPLSLNLFVAGASQSGTVSRPFTDAASGMPATGIVAQPNMASGAVEVASSSRLWGTELNGVAGLGRDGHGYLTDLLFGVRHLELAESLGIVQASQPLANGGLSFEGIGLSPPSGVLIADHFQTRNQFYGGQFGCRSECRWAPFFLSATAEVALGWSHQSVDVLGNTRLFASGSVDTVPGGLLALPTNIGRTTREAFAAVPQVGLNVGFACTDWLRLSVGYNLLYWSSVVRPGDQINTAINQTQVPSSPSFGPFSGPVQPVPFFVTRDFWVQGVNFGVEVHY